jgi:hypothetical protein
MLESKNKDGTQWRMKTVYDLMRHHTALEVLCGNCPNSAVLNNRFLSRNYGIDSTMVYVKSMPFRTRSEYDFYKPAYM